MSTPQLVKKHSLKVVIGVPCFELGRFNVFNECLDALIKPDDSAILRVRGQSVSANRNVIIEKAIEHDSEYVFFLDDDLVFASDTLIKLLSHDKDYVVGHYCMRNYPFKSIIFDHQNPDGSVRWFTLNGDKGLVPVKASGAGGLLVKTEVFKRVTPLVNTFGKKCWFTLGQIDPDLWNDDIDFCHLMNKNEVEMYCDLNAPIGHVMTSVIWPNYDEAEKKWDKVLDVNGIQIKVPEKK